ncbi:MAG: efflux RND transporter periplasmic adaptor subunit, partial [Kiritimatiellae bacterium]|nr:efflux RND transporter periplasmic adaptor subunit [Kiritimatiellia bacterium]
ERAYPGRVVPIAQVNVVPQVSGEILEVAFENGALVKAGDLLYRLDPVKYEAAVKNAESKLAEAKANAQYAELSYDRHKKLLESRAVSLDAVDNALSQRDSSRAALAAAQAELVAARDDLAHCTIVAPIAGRLGTTSKTKGHYVTKGSETLVTLVQQDPVRVRFSIANRDLLENFRGTGISSEDATVDLTLADGVTMVRDGVPEYMENAADEQTDTVQVYVRFGNSDKLLTVGGTVGVTLTARKGAVRPAIPPTAILQDTQGPYVWALGPDGRAERRTVARGDLGGDWLFIEKGLKIGERVVADGAHKVRKGDVIRPAPTSR